MPGLGDVRDTRIAGERESLIKLHLVKQTSLHSSCQSGRIYVVVNKERYLGELTETNLGHARPYIIHSTPHPRSEVSSQVGFPDAAQTAVVETFCCLQKQSPGESKSEKFRIKRKTEPCVRWAEQ